MKVQRKIGPKFRVVGKRVILIGCKETGYILLKSEEGKLYESRDVRFCEKLAFKDRYKKTDVKDWEILENEIKTDTWFLVFDKEDEKKDDETQGTEGDPKRIRGRPRKVQHEEIEMTDEKLHAFLTEVNGDPKSYTEAMNSKERQKWMEAINNELESMYKNNVWKLVERTSISDKGKGQNIIDSRWVFKRKTESDNTVRHEARLVVRGFKDRNEYDLQETYTPVSRLPLIRSVLAIVNKLDLEICQMDVKTAFLNGSLNSEVFMEIPEGVNISNEVRSSKVCKLEKALYGLKVSSKCWNEKFRRTVEKYDLKPFNNEPCLFTKSSEDNFLILILYVDDILLAYTSRLMLKEMKENLKREFEMTDVGEPKSFLGLEIARDRQNKILTIKQEKFIDGVLQKFGFKNSHTQRTPMVTN